MYKTILILFFAVITFVNCSKKNGDNNDSEPHLVTKNNNLPKDEFHGFAQTKDSPGDPDYHKGTGISEKIGLEKKTDSAGGHPNTPDDVIKRYSDILLDDPDNANAWLMVGNGFLLKGQIKDAIPKYKKSLAITSTPEAYSNLGFAYYDLKDFENAIFYHQKALDMDPKFANSYYGIALIHDKKGESEKALINWKGFLKVAKKDSRWLQIAKEKVKEMETK